jgi:polysaccharide biosynthesis transport protein
MVVICYHRPLGGGLVAQEDRVDMPNLPNLRDDRDFSLGVLSPGLPEPPMRNPRRHRLIVFSGVFLAVLAAGLSYTFLQPAVYRATARLHILTGSAAPAPIERTAAGVAIEAQPGGRGEPGSKSFLTEVQVLTSRPLLEEVVDRLRQSHDLPNDIASEPVDAAQQMLSTETVEGTDVVQVRAEGPHRQFVARLVNTLTSVYQEYLAASYQKSTATDTDQFRDSVRALDQQVAARRQEVEAFRSSNDIASEERDENQVFSAAKNLATALSEAKGKLAAAEGQVRAVRNGASSGQALVTAKDNPTIADLEKRASQMREELQDLQQRYTPQYLGLDPAIKAARARLDNVEQQIRTERAAGQRSAIVEAEAKVVGANEAVDQLQEQINQNKRTMQTFVARFGDYKAMKEDLTHLEQLRRAASDRLAKLEASVKEAAPRAEILEAANVPRLPWRPLYDRDAGITLVAAFALGFFGVWLVEYFARPQPPPTAAVGLPWWPVPVGRGALAPSQPLLTAEAARLPAPEPLPRELTDAEIDALLQAAGDDGRLIVTGLLSGLSAEEIAALDWDQIDLDAGTIQVSGESPRSLPLNDPLRRLIAARRELQPQAEGTVLHGPSGGRLPVEDLRSLVTYAAYDAGIDGADEVTLRTLRHTYLVYLLRQGIRFADIGRIVGRLPQEELAAYTRFAPSQPRLPLEQIDPVLPALRDVTR